jgi:dihydrodipicolinate synthase/N-acetylneuraminate lyase
MYGMIKETLRIMGAPDIGGVRAPLYDITEEDKAICRECAKQIQILVSQYA